MSMLGVFILSTAIGISTSRGPASETSDAYKALIKASYIETEADKSVKKFEKKYVPIKLKEYGGWITGTTRLVLDKKISFEWTF